MTDLSYIDTGKPESCSDDVLLFLHGIMMSKDVWLNQIDYFSPHYRVITVDLAGFGSSPGSKKPANFSDHAADVIHLLDKLGIQQVHLAGWSMGGCIAIILADKYPHYIKTVTLIDTTPKLIAGDDFPCAIPAAAAEGLINLMTTKPEDGIAGFIEMIFPETNSADIRGPVLKTALATDINVTLNHFAYSAMIDLRPALSHIHQPALIIYGTLDEVCFPAASKFLADHIANSHLVALAGAGHAPFLTMPDIFNRQLHDFIDANNHSNIL